MPSSGSRGVAVVIPPWNFPLAIPTGMTVAALVTGNTVVLKPSERAPLMSTLLADILREAGLPSGVLAVLTGFGELGRALVEHPEVDLIAFTGSRDVGLEINRKAAETSPGQDHVKRVIAEMGGKNAIIVDDDADLDEAVVGVLQLPSATPARSARPARGSSSSRACTTPSCCAWPRPPRP